MLRITYTEPKLEEQLVMVKGLIHSLDDEDATELPGSVARYFSLNYLKVSFMPLFRKYLAPIPGISTGEVTSRGL